MRLAVFSDIHGNLTAFEAAWADYQAVGGADVIWFLGDLAAMGPFPGACIERMMALANDAKAAAEADPGKRGAFRALSGNTDRYLVTGMKMRGKGAEKPEDLPAFQSQIRSRDAVLNWSLAQLNWDEYAFLRQLEGECALDVPGFGRVIGYHAIPGDDEGYLTPQTPEEEAADALLDREGRLAIGGHIHEQMDRTLRTGWRVINVGSVGMSFQMPGRAQWGLFTFEGDQVHVDLRAVPYDLDAVIADVYAVGVPEPEWLTGYLRRDR